MTNNRVFLYIPNLIGYLRVFLYAGAFIGHTWGGHWEIFVGLYSLAFLLDEFDGRAARQFKQSSHFGAALDMVTDRCSTAGLCLILSELYPEYTSIFILLIALDIGSHYYLLYATAIGGYINHKEATTWSKNRLLTLYYGNKPFMDALIIGNELLYLLLYSSYYVKTPLLSWMGGSLSFVQITILVCLPLYVIKQSTNVLQLLESIKAIAQVDNA